jgi:formylglycine-generating enzyme required for sulfatase activity
VVKQTETQAEEKERSEMNRQWIRTVLVMAILALVTGAAWANNLSITNVTVTPRDATTAYVKFDISWQNSWRYTNINHDAAWVFFKAQPELQTYWTNVILEYSGVNPTGCSTGTGTAVQLIVPDDKVGLFVRPAGEGTAPVAVTNVQVVWNFASNGLTTASKVKIRALAVEMVYVAQGSFDAGDGLSGQGQFTKTTITTNDPTVAGGRPTGETAPVATWPNGYNAFYCMKYEITQGQYKDFLNSLTSGQDGTRFPNNNGNYRHTITGSAGSRTTATPDRACNWLSWADGAAFADWAGLRPMTELEFEKACRGPIAAVAGEYAWGSTVITQLTAEANDGTGTSTVSTVAGANCLYGNGAMQGPCRVGIFATASSTREQAGASYWGIMELSGNLWERPVTIGHATGRNFTGLHGDGNLDGTGDANVTAWPGTDAAGAGMRGGHWVDPATIARVSDRAYAAGPDAIRSRVRGGRAVRSAPSGVGP